jgi:hypothetical protein
MQLPPAAGSKERQKHYTVTKKAISYTIKFWSLKPQKGDSLDLGLLW